MRPRGALVTLALFLTGGCAAQPRVVEPPPRIETPLADVYVVVPGADGTVGAITVTRGTDQQVLDSAYATARFPARDRLEISRLTPEEVRAIFGATADALPPRPVSFRLYFVFGTDALTPESTLALDNVSPEIARRPVAEVVVIGHTDRVGTLEQNDVLSLQRAERVRRELLRVGVAPERITVAGRGEREPLVPTDDEVPEPKNRRVEITVR